MSTVKLLEKKEKEILKLLGITLEEEIKKQDLNENRLETLKKLLKKFHFELEMKNGELLENYLLRNYSMLLLCRFDDENLIKGNCQKKDDLNFFESILNLIQTQNNSSFQDFNDYSQMTSSIIQNSHEIFQQKLELFPNDIIFKKGFNVQEEIVNLEESLNNQKIDFKNVSTEELKEFLFLMKKFNEIYKNKESESIKQGKFNKEIEKKSKNIIETTNKLKFIEQHLDDILRQFHEVLNVKTPKNQINSNFLSEMSKLKDQLDELKKK
eukprot:gene3779-6667_t